jgi:hypothetical protein
MLDEVEFLELPEEEAVNNTFTKEELVLDLIDSFITRTDYKSVDPFEYRTNIVKEFSVNNDIDEEYIWDTYNSRLRLFIEDRVKAYTESKLDTYNRILARSTLESQLKFFILGKENIKVVIDYFEREQSKPVVMNTREFLSMAKSKDNADYIVESILHRRMFLMLVAYAKVGKTAFAYNLLVAVATGKDWLNRKTYPTKCLLIQNEEGLIEASKKVYTNRLEQCELDDPDTFNSLIEENRIIVMKDIDIVEDLELIFSTVEKEGIGLIIIDSLSASLKKCGLNELSSELGGHIYNLQSYVHKYGVCCLLLHHTTKMENPESQSDRLKSAAGRSQLPRATDGQILLSPTIEHKQVILNKVTAFFDLRHGSPFSLKLERVEEEANQWHWVVTGEDLLSGVALTNQNNILRVLYARFCEWMDENDPELSVYGCTTSDLMDILGLTRETIIQRMNWMIRAGGIEYKKNSTTKSYVYHFPADGYSWLYKYVEEEDERESAKARLEQEDQAVRDALAAAVTNEQVELLLQPLSKEDKNRIWSKVPKEEKDRILLLRHPPVYEVGSLVKYENQCYTVERVVFGSEPKDVPVNERRLYYLKGLVDPVRELELQVYVEKEPAEEVEQEFNNEN